MCVDKVLDALIWLTANNPQYSDIEINYDSLYGLPINGIPEDLPTVDTVNEKGQCDDYDEDPQGDVDDLVYDQHSEMSSFMPVPPNKQQEMEAIQHQFSVYPNMTWPSRDSEPLSEFKTPFLATLAFPSLFPSSAGDPTNPSLMRDVKFGEKIKHLLKFGELENGNWVYRFARHPRFAYWALNMIQRKQALGQAAFFYKTKSK